MSPDDHLKYVHLKAAAWGRALKCGADGIETLTRSLIVTKSMLRPYPWNKMKYTDEYMNNFQILQQYGINIFQEKGKEHLVISNEELEHLTLFYFQLKKLRHLKSLFFQLRESPCPST